MKSIKFSMPLMSFVGFILLTCGINTDAQSYKNTYTNSYINSEVTQYIHPKTFTSNGVTYRMFWTNPSSYKKRDPAPDYVREIYFVPTNFSPKYKTVQEEVPPRLIKIRLHEMSKDNAFIGAIVEEKVTDQNWYVFEIRLPDEVANLLMDLVKGRTKYKIVKSGTLDKMFGGANMEYLKTPGLLPRHHK